MALECLGPSLIALFELLKAVEAVATLEGCVVVVDVIIEEVCETLCYGCGGSPHHIQVLEFLIDRERTIPSN